MLAAGQIRAGDGDLYVAAGVESMTNAPFMDLKGRQGHKYGHFEMMDAILWDGLWDHVENWVMGEAAELIAREYGITRAEMDAFSTRSHQLAHQATEDGCFKEEIVPVELRDRKGNVTLFDRDESIRPDTTVETLARLKPAFIEDGLVTAGNSPGLNDGAAALVVASRAYAEQKGHAPLARHRGAMGGGGRAEVGCSPRRSTPSRLRLERAGWDGGRPRPGRDQRGVRRASAGRPQGLKQNGRRNSAGKAERPRRRDRDRPPDRRVRRARAGHV